MALSNFHNDKFHVAAQPKQTSNSLLKMNTNEMGYSDRFIRSNHSHPSTFPICNVQWDNKDWPVHSSAYVVFPRLLLFSL